jgi:hypothetical protein
MSNKTLSTLRAHSARLAALEMAVHGYVRQRLSKRQLAEAEGISTRTVDRRVADGVYVTPEVESGRLYWWSDSFRRGAGVADTPELRALRDPRRRKQAETTQAR